MIDNIFIMRNFVQDAEMDNKISKILIEFLSTIGIIALMNLSISQIGCASRVPNTEWTLTWRGYVSPVGLVTDNSGNIYAYGGFKDTVDLNPGSGVTRLTAAGEISSYLMKLSINGDLLWLTSEDGILPRHITISQTQDIYVTGQIETESDLRNADTGGPNLERLKGTAYAAKYDSSGNLLWSFSWEEQGYMETSCIAAGNNGAIFVCGSFLESVDLNPGPAIRNATAADGFSAFICAFNDNGDLIWLDVYEREAWSDESLSVTADSYGNVYLLTSSVSCPLLIEGNTVEVQEKHEMRLAKYSPEGLVMWSAELESEGEFYWFGDIALADNDAIFVTGAFSDDIHGSLSGDNPVSAQSSGFMDIFIASFANDGSLLQLKTLGESGNDTCSAIAIDEDHNVYVTGAMAMGVDPATGEQTLDPLRQTIYLGQYDSTLTPLWEWTYPRFASGRTLALDIAGSLYIAGEMYNGSFLAKLNQLAD